MDGVGSVGSVVIRPFIIISGDHRTHHLGIFSPHSFYSLTSKAGKSAA